MKILILGGTGAMGNHLVKLLGNKNHDILITSRSPKKSINKIRYIQGDAKDATFLITILSEQWDAIVDFMVYSTTTFQERVNLLLNSTSQYLFLSSARVYAEFDEPILETSPLLLEVSTDKTFLSTDEYSLAKARQEEILKNSGKNNWTIIRPYITYSNQRLQLGILEKEDWLYRALSGRTIVFSEDINKKLTTMTFGSDVARGIASLIGKSEALGITFHITSNKPTGWDDILEIYLEVLERHLGKKPKVLFENLDNFLKYHPAIYQVKYDRLYNRKFNNSKIAQFVDVDSFTSIQDGLKGCLEEFIRDPVFKPINWHAEALKDRKTKEFTRLSEIKGIKQKVKYLIYRFFIN